MLIEEAAIIAVRVVAAAVVIVVAFRLRGAETLYLRRTLILGSLVLVLSVLALGSLLLALRVDSGIVRGLYSAATAIVLIIGLAIASGRR